MNEKQLTITVDEADLLVAAIEAAVADMRELGNKLILGTNARRAGMNQLAWADTLEAVGLRINDMFPYEEEEE